MTDVHVAGLLIIEFMDPKPEDSYLCIFGEVVDDGVIAVLRAPEDTKRRHFEVTRNGEHIELFAYDGPVKWPPRSRRQWFEPLQDDSE